LNRINTHSKGDLMSNQFQQYSAQNFLQCLCLSLLLLGALLSAGCKSTVVEAAGGGQIHGYVSADLGANGPVVRLPGAVVYVKDQAGNAGPRVATDSEGQYVIPRKPAGSYTVCAELTGFEAKCAPEAVKVERTTAYANDDLLLKPIPPFLATQVATKDGGSCEHENALFATSQHTVVTVLNASGTTVAGPLKTNGSGEVIIPQLPSGPYKLKVACGNIEQKINNPEVKAFSEGEQPTLSKIIVENQKPKIISIAATMKGEHVDFPPPGSKLNVEVKVEDPDSDSLTYRWRNADGYELPSPGSTVDWEIPSFRATHVLYVEVTDGRGGIVDGSVAVRTDAVTPLASVVDHLGQSTLKPNFGFLENKANFQLGLPDHRPFLSRKGLGSEQEANDYYTSIGARPNKETFDQWLAANGFDGTEPVTIYYNAYDLGLGREMHCRRGPGADPDVACYVTNYTGQSGAPVPVFPADPNLALPEAIARKNPFATVAMEYSALPGGGPKTVKFYVYGGDRKLSVRAQLDNEGQKFVPRICLVCHGGEVTVSGSNVTVDGAFFREFDVFSFIYDPGLTLAQQQRAFWAQNDIVKSTKPAPAIVDLINGMFPGDENVPPVNTYVPPGWLAGGTSDRLDHSDLYQKIVREYCRACHIAQGSGIDFTRYDDFLDSKNSIVRQVCTLPKRTMPNAEVPFSRFWLDGTGAPTFLQTQLNLASCNP
jgi:hypothetical protein